MLMEYLLCLLSLGFFHLPIKAQGLERVDASRLHGLYVVRMDQAAGLQVCLTQEYSSSYILWPWAECFHIIYRLVLMKEGHLAGRTGLSSQEEAEDEKQSKEAARPGYRS